MTQRSMILSAFLAALVLVVIGGVVANLTGPEPTELAQAGPAAQSAADPATAAEVVEASVPKDRLAFAEREAAYRRLIEEANRRLTAQQRALDTARAEREATAASLPPATAYRDDRDHDDDHDDDDEHERDERWDD